MRGTQAIVLIVLYSGAVLLAGCGSVPMSIPTAPSSTNLKGNWLLSGQLPSSVPQRSSAVGITATFDVDGDAITGILSGTVICGGPVAVQLPVEGTVAKNGTFTLQTPEGSFIVGDATINGTVPTTAAGSWSGSYEITEPSALDCSMPFSGTFGATSIAQLNGTYAGTATMASAAGGTLQLSMTLDQGEPASGFTTGSDLSIGGRIAVQGLSCLTSGTVVSSSPTIVADGPIEGNAIAIQFQMNDGSYLTMLGSITALDASQIAVVVSVPESCAGAVETNPVVLMKQ